MMFRLQEVILVKRTKELLSLHHLPPLEVVELILGTLSDRRFRWRRRRDDRQETGARTVSSCGRNETNFACLTCQMLRAEIILHVKRVLLKHVIAIFNQSLYHRSLRKKTGVFLDYQDLIHTQLVELNIDFIAKHRFWTEFQLTALVIRRIDRSLKYRSLLIK